MERDVGIVGYLTSTPGVGGTLKDAPEDFVVEEISSPPPPSAEGRFTVATIRVRNWETNRLVRELARALHVSRRRIGFAGTKDKHAVTTRLFSFEGIPIDAVRELHLKDVEVLDAFRSDRPLEIRGGDRASPSAHRRIPEFLRGPTIRLRAADHSRRRTAHREGRIPRGGRGVRRESVGRRGPGIIRGPVRTPRHRRRPAGAAQLPTGLRLREGDPEPLGDPSGGFRGRSPSPPVQPPDDVRPRLSVVPVQSHLERADPPGPPDPG